MVSIKSILSGLVFVLVGVAIAGFGMYTGYYQVQEINSGVEMTEATIQSSGIAEVEETEEGETSLEYYPEITYQYTVDGETYTGERIYSHLDRSQEQGEREGIEYDSEGRAQQMASSFPQGQTVPVHHYADDPSRSFLVKPEVNWVETAGFGLFGAVFALGGVASIFSD